MAIDEGIQLQIDAVMASRQAAMASGSINQIIEATRSWQRTSVEFAKTHGVSMNAVIRTVKAAETATAQAHRRIASDGARAAAQVARTAQEYQRAQASIAASNDRLQSSIRGIGQLGAATAQDTPLRALIGQSQAADAELRRVRVDALRAAEAAKAINLNNLSPDKARAVTNEVRRAEMAFSAAAQKAELAKKQMNDALNVKAARGAGGGGGLGLGALIGVGAAMEVGRGLVSTISEFQGVQSSLLIVTRDVATANAEFARLTQLAARTPFTVEEVTKAFIRLKGVGLDASNEALERYGDLAASIPGKTIGQVIEAVADATQGRDIRLKEFGGNLRVMGEQVEVTLGGARRVVENNAKAIEKALMSLSKEKFGGAMAGQAKTLVGQLSNLRDSVALAVLDIGEGGLAPALSNAVTWMSSTTSGSRELARSVGAVLGAGVNLATGAMQFLVEHGTMVKTVLYGIGTAWTVMKVASWAGELQVAWVAMRAGVGVMGQVTVAMGTATTATGALRAGWTALMAVSPVGWIVGIATALSTVLVPAMQYAEEETRAYFASNQQAMDDWKAYRESWLNDVLAFGANATTGGLAGTIAAGGDRAAASVAAERAAAAAKAPRADLAGMGKTAGMGFAGALFGADTVKDAIAGWDAGQLRAAANQTETLATATSELAIAKKQVEAIKDIQDPFLRKVEIEAIKQEEAALKELANAKGRVLTEDEKAQARTQVYASVYELLTAQKALEEATAKNTKGGESELSKQRKGIADDLKQLAAQYQTSKQLLAAAQAGMGADALDIEAKVLGLTEQYDKLGAAAKRAAEEQARALLTATKDADKQREKITTAFATMDEIKLAHDAKRGAADDALMVAKMGFSPEEADFQLSFLAQLRAAQLGGIEVTQKYSDEIYASMKATDGIQKQADALLNFAEALARINEETARTKQQNATSGASTFGTGRLAEQAQERMEQILAPIKDPTSDQVQRASEAAERWYREQKIKGTRDFLADGSAKVDAENSKLALMQQGLEPRELEIQLDYTKRLAEYQVQYGDASTAVRASILSQTEALHDAAQAQEDLRKQQEFAKAGFAPFVQYFEQNANIFANTASLMTSSFDDFINRFVEGLWTGKFEFEDFASDIGKKLLQLAIKFAVVQGINLLLPGAGAAVGGLGGILAGVFHDGGVVGRDGGSRIISPSLVRGAPRYHSGTPYAGLKTDEMVAILQEGEEVVPRGKRRSGGGSARRSGPTTVTNRNRTTYQIFAADARGVETAVAEMERRRAARERKKSL